MTPNVKIYTQIVSSFMKPTYVAILEYCCISIPQPFFLTFFQTDKSLFLSLSIKGILKYWLLLEIDISG